MQTEIFYRLASQGRRSDIVDYFKVKDDSVGLFKALDKVNSDFGYIQSLHIKNLYTERRIENGIKTVLCEVTIDVVYENAATTEEFNWIENSDGPVMRGYWITNITSK